VLERSKPTLLVHHTPTANGVNIYKKYFCEYVVLYIPAEARHFSLLQNVLGPTQPPILWLLGFFPSGKLARVWNRFTTHLRLVLRLRLSGV